MKMLKRQLLSAALRDVKSQESDLVIRSVFKKLIVGLVGDEAPDFSNQVISLLQNGDIDAFLTTVSRSAVPLEHGTAISYWKYATVASFLSKFPFKKATNLNPMKAAIERSAKAELLCRLTNKRLSYWFGRTDPTGFSKEWRLNKTRRRYLHEVFHLARLKILNWLGPASSGEVAELARHGPGGCLGVKRPGTTEYFKYSAETYTATARCFPYVKALLDASPNWVRSLSGLGPFDEGPSLPVDKILRERCTVTDYNKVTYVPKTARTHRAIAVEPMLNVYFQLGVGRVIRRRLRSHGHDLSSCWERNKMLAQQGSKEEDGLKLSTIDLSMASDTLAIELVRDLLPPDWFDLLWALRSPNGDFNGTLKPWAKFSSMGNGYTFELETLIFLALAKSVCEVNGINSSKVSVFGDDIILPTDAYDTFSDCLRFCGFSLNQEKSFPRGPFRESCGGDYFQGQDVRPFYLKREIRSVRDLIFLRNSLRIHLRKGVEMRAIDQKLVNSIVEFIDSRMPGFVRDHLLGPETGPIDGVLYTDFDLAHKSYFVLWDRDLQEMRYPVLRDRPRRYSGESCFVYLQFMGGTRPGASDFENVPWIRKDQETPSSRSIVVKTQSTVTKLSSELALCWA